MRDYTAKVLDVSQFLDVFADWLQEWLFKLFKRNLLPFTDVKDLVSISKSLKQDAKKIRCSRSIVIQAPSRFLLAVREWEWIKRSPFEKIRIDEVHNRVELLGHKNNTMTMRYPHHYPESLRHGVDILYSFGQKNAQSGHIVDTLGKKERVTEIVTL